MTALRLPSTLTNAQATACLQQLQAGLAQLPAGSAAVVDASALAVFDSAALAVLLECRRTALAAGQTFQVADLPSAAASLARLYGVEGMLQAA